MPTSRGLITRTFLIAVLTVGISTVLPAADQSMNQFKKLKDAAPLAFIAFQVAAVPLDAAGTPVGAKTVDSALDWHAHAFAEAIQPPGDAVWSWLMPPASPYPVIQGRWTAAGRHLQSRQTRNTLQVRDLDHAVAADATDAAVLAAANDLAAIVFPGALQPYAIVRRIGDAAFCLPTDYPNQGTATDPQSATVACASGGALTIAVEKTLQDSAAVRLESLKGTASEQTWPSEE